MNSSKFIQLCNFNGYANCKSMFLNSKSTMNNEHLSFAQGVNVLHGDFDSGAWATCYSASMAPCSRLVYRRYGVIYSTKPEILLNGKMIDCNSFADLSCYLDYCFPLFKKKRSVRRMIERGLKKHKCFFSYETICQFFEIQKEREDRYVTQVGNDLFRSMAAIGVAWNKEIFFFPWISEAMVKYYGKQLTDVLEGLSNLNKVVVIPTNSTALKIKYQLNRE